MNLELSVKEDNQIGNEPQRLAVPMFQLTMETMLKTVVDITVEFMRHHLLEA